MALPRNKSSNKELSINQHLIEHLEKSPETACKKCWSKDSKGGGRGGVGGKSAPSKREKNLEEKRGHVKEKKKKDS